MSWACFFNTSIRLNLTTHTPIPDQHARFSFFASIAKYHDEIFPTWTVTDMSILSSNIPNDDRISLRIVFMYIISLLLKFSPEP